MFVSENQILEPQEVFCYLEIFTPGRQLENNFLLSRSCIKIFSRFSSHCPNTVIETSSSLDKSEIQVNSQTGNRIIETRVSGDVDSSQLRIRLCYLPCWCPGVWVRFRILFSLFTVALISEYLSEIWSEDEGRLRLRLCEEKNEEEEVNIIQSECCACQEAKYEVMFQVSRDDPLHYKDKCFNCC